MSHDPVRDEALFDYAAGDLKAAAARLIDARIATDPELADRVARIRGILDVMRADDSQAPAPAVVARAKAIFERKPQALSERWFGKLRQVIAEIVFDSRAQVALAGFRGATDRFQLAAESASASIDLQFEPHERDGRRSWTIIGQIEPSESHAASEVAFVATDNAVEAVADADGVFRFEALPGSYDLFVRVSADEILHVPKIHLT